MIQAVSVSSLDPIRAYFMAEALKQEVATLKVNTRAALKKKLAKVNRQAAKLTPRQLFNQPLDHHHGRYDNYVNSSWRLMTIPLADCGVWPAFGGLPLKLTFGTVVDTATELSKHRAGRKKLSVEVAKALYIYRLMDYADLIAEFIPIIVMEGGVIRHMKLYEDDNQKKFKRTKYDIDDGNHRAIAHVLQGKKEIVALVGKRMFKNPMMY